MINSPAQTVNGPLQTIKIKFKKEHTATLRGVRAAYHRNIGVVQTGMLAIDQLHRRYGVVTFEKMYPYNKKFHRRHEAAGLHLWYKLKARLPQGLTVDECLEAYKQCGLIETSEQEYTKIAYGKPAINTAKDTPPAAYRHTFYPDDPYFDHKEDHYFEHTGQWHFHNPFVPGADIDLLSAWELERGKPSVIIAVMDNAIDIDHYDLVENIWKNEVEKNGLPGVDDDGNGYVDDVYGYNFADTTANIIAQDHGTHVAGTIAAKNNNGMGVASVAGGYHPGEGVKVMNCTLLQGKFLGEVAGVEEAFVYAADNGAVISQNSWGYGKTGVFEQSVKEAIDYFINYAGQDENGHVTGPMKGGIVMFSAGNDDSEEKSYPAAYEKVMAVAATDIEDKRSSFSNYGDWVDIAAPGTHVISTLRINTTSINRLDEGVGRLSGTSMACPHVSGVAALVISQLASPELLPHRVWDRLVRTAEDLDARNPGYVGKLGAGRLNAYQALTEEDGVPPASIEDFRVEGVTFESATLQWTAPGASERQGKAHHYEIRMSQEPITADNFEQAIKLVPPRPSLAGEKDTLKVEGLYYNSTYYFALKAVDAYGAVSPLPANLTVTTTAPPVFTMDDTPVVANIYRDETRTVSLNIANRGNAGLHFNVGLPLAKPHPDLVRPVLSHLLYAFNEQYQAVTNVIPDEHMIERVMRYRVADSPFDFIEGGNILGTDQGDSIHYTDGRIVNATQFGDKGRYFTRNFPGLFLLAADLDNTAYLQISGRLENNPGQAHLPANVEGYQWTMLSHGVQYTGFYKQVYNKRKEYTENSFGPSLSHLIIVEHDDKVNHEYRNDVEDDFHRIQNLNEVKRLYYLLYSSDDGQGGFITRDENRTIMETFLNVMKNTWLSTHVLADTLLAGQGRDIKLHLDATGLSPGTYEKEVIIHSNDPDRITNSLYVILNVVNQPPMFTSPLQDLYLSSSTDSVRIDLFARIHDPDQDRLHYEVTTTPPGCQNYVDLQDSLLILTSGCNEDFTVQIKVTDGHNGSAMDEFNVTVEKVTSMPSNEFKGHNSLHISPNPAASKITLNYYLSQSADVQFILYNYQGRVIDTIDIGQRQAGDYTFSANMMSLAPGVYLYVMKTSSANTFKKVVKE